MSSIDDEIPIEFQMAYTKIPENERESYNLTLNRNMDDSHRYIKNIHTILETMKVYREPSSYWMFIIGKLCFTSAQYDKLSELREQEKYLNDRSLKIFHARVLTYSNNFDEAEKLILEVLDDIDLDNELSLLDILLYFEGYFSKGLNYIFSRKFDKLQEVIDTLVANSSKYKLKKALGDHYLDMIYYEHILKVSIKFQTGNLGAAREELSVMTAWVDNLQDTWKKGYYYNLLGINHFQHKEMQEGEASLKKAYIYFNEVHDLRGYVSVGANLGVSYITQGLIEEGRAFIENVLESMITLKNYSFAITFMLTVSKSYINTKDEKNALRMLKWAEEVSTNANIVEPATYSLFSYFYSRFGNMEKSDELISKLYEMTHIGDKDEENDIYASLWYYSASSVNALKKGEMRSADELIKKGIRLAEKSHNHDIILESSLIHLEILMKRFLLDGDLNYIKKSLEVLDDLKPYVHNMSENSFYEAIFHLINAYLRLALEQPINAKSSFETAKEAGKDNPTSDQNRELVLYSERQKFIDFANSEMGKNNQFYSQVTDYWFSDNYFLIFYTMEALRLLVFIQFAKANMGQQARETEITPDLLLVVAPGGITTFTYKFAGGKGTIDEFLIGGFLSAITSFSRELFGGGGLSKIEQDNFVLLIENAGSDNFIVLIVEKETYAIRKKFKKFVAAVKAKSILAYLGADIIVSDVDPISLEMQSILEDSFDIK